MGSEQKSDIIFLDTHITVWLYQKNLELLSEKVLNLIENYDMEISPIIELELEYLYEIGKLKINSSRIIKYLHDKIDLNIDKIYFNEIIKTAINEKWTRDPFDRIIVSHAKARNAYLISADKKIRNHYAKTII